MENQSDIKVAIAKLKSAIRTHMIVYNGPSQQLAAFMIKVIDFIEDDDEYRKTTEINNLSYIILESAAFYLVNFIHSNKERSHNLIDQSNELLVSIGKTRNIKGSQDAEQLMLYGIANLLRSMNKQFNVNYPAIKDHLNNTI